MYIFRELRFYLIKEAWGWLLLHWHSVCGRTVFCAKISSRNRCAGGNERISIGESCMRWSPFISLLLRNYKFQYLASYGRFCMGILWNIRKDLAVCNREHAYTKSDLIRKTGELKVCGGLWRIISNGNMRFKLERNAHSFNGRTLSDVFAVFAATAHTRIIP